MEPPAEAEAVENPPVEAKAVENHGAIPAFGANAKAPEGPAPEKNRLYDFESIVLLSIIDFGIQSVQLSALPFIGLSWKYA